MDWQGKREIAEVQEIAEISEETEATHNRHDKGYKYLLSTKRLFVQLLRSFVKEGWVDKITPDDVELVDKSFILPDFSNKEADLVYKVNFDGSEIFFYLLELQSTVDEKMPMRLLLYMVEIWRTILKDSWGSDSENGESKEFGLPVIVPCVLYNGSRNWTVPKKFRDILNRSQEFGEHVVDFEYILIDVKRYSDEDLKNLANLIGAVFFVDKTDRKKEEIFERLREIVEKLGNLALEDANLFFNWLKNVFFSGQKRNLIDDVENIIVGGKGENTLMHSLERFAKEYYQEALEKGIEQGIEQTREQELVGTAKTLLRKKYKIEVLSEELSHLIDKTSLNALENFKELIFDIEKLDDAIEYFKSNQRENKYDSEDEKFESKNKLNEEVRELLK